MAVAQVKQRIEPKVLAALVNRFTAETAEFLTAFATQAEAKLLQLSQRLERLERLVALFERKVQHLDAAPSGVSLGPVAAEPVSAPSVARSSEGPQEPASHEAPPEVQAAPPQEDEKYAVYRRMHRTGVPLLAIRQKLLLDALQDPTLDVAVLDTFDGAAGTGAGAPAPKTAPAPKPKEVAIEEPPPPAPAAPEEEPSPAPAELPAPGGGGPINLAAAAAAMAQRRMSRRHAAKVEGSEPGEPKAPTETAPAVPKGGPPKAKPKAMPKAEEPAAAPAAPAAPAGPIGLFAAAEEGTAPKAPVRTPPPPPKAKASAMSPEAALRLRRSVVAQVQEDDAQSDVSDF